MKKIYIQPEIELTVMEAQSALMTISVVQTTHQEEAQENVQF